MFTTLSFISMLIIGCGDTNKNEKPSTEPTKKEEMKPEEQRAEKAHNEMEKEMEKLEALEEETKAEPKEETKEEEAKEEEAKEEIKEAPKKAAPTEKQFSARVTVSKLPENGRKERFEKEAKEMLSKMAAKAGYPKMIGSISFVGDMPKCPNDKCIWTAKASFSK